MRLRVGSHAPIQEHIAIFYITSHGTLLITIPYIRTPEIYP